MFNSWLLLVRGTIRRTGRSGVSLRATGAWSLEHIYAHWRDALERAHHPDAAIAAVHRIIDADPASYHTPQQSTARKLWHSSPGSIGR